MLIWGANNNVGNGAFSNFSLIKSVYEAMGLGVHSPVTWTGTLANYKLIIWPMAESNPPWWGLIASDTWRGRIHITAENSGFPATIAYVNGLAGVTGIGVTAAFIDIDCYHEGTAEAGPDLMSGQSTMRYALTSQVTGGTALSKTVTGAVTWLARNKPGSNIDFVVSGDVNHIHNECGADVINNNTPFIQNLWDVAV